MRPVSAGNVSAIAVTTAQANATQATASPPPARNGAMRPAVIPMPSRRASELHLRRLRGTLDRGELRHRLVGTEEGRGPQEAGEGLELGVVDPHRLDVVAPGDGDAVLGALELRLQRQEVLVRLEVGIVLARRDQPAERAGELVLRVLELLELLRIGQLRGVDLDLGCL